MIPFKRNRTLYCVLLAFCSALSIVAHAQTTVSGTKVLDNTGALLASGQWCFNSTCLTVTNGHFTGTVTPGTQTVTVTNGGAVTYLTVPGVVIGSSAYNWDGFVVPTAASISGMGSPRIACQTAAAYTQTDAPVISQNWTCSASPLGQATWLNIHQGGSAAPMGNYAGVGVPTFTCTVPCTYQRTDVLTLYALAGSNGTTGSSWQIVVGGAGGGFPITLGSTSIASGSTTTSVAGLTVDGVAPSTMAFVDPLSSVQGQLNAKQGTLTLTTTGTSGASTLIGNTLNIPQYGGGGGSTPTGTGFVHVTSGTQDGAAVNPSFSQVTGNLGTTQGPALTGLLKDAAGTMSAAVAGTDYLTPSGNGSALTALNATQLTSGTIPNARIATLPLANLATQAADSIIGNFSAVTSAPTAGSLLSCSGAGNALTYNTSTHVFGCNTITGSGGNVNAGGTLNNNAVVIGQGTQNVATISADTTTTHALFATAGAPAFRAIVAGDIPTLNQNTTGTAGGLSGSPAITVSNVTDSALTPGNCVQAGTGGLLTTTGSGCGTSGGGITTLAPAAYGSASGATGTLLTQRGLNAVVDWGLDNTGATDVGATINTKCAAYSTSSTNPEVFFPAGTYLVTTPIACTGSSTAINNLTFIGEGRSAQSGPGVVTFNCNTPNQTCTWFENVTATTANQKGPKLAHITMIDTSTSKNDFALLRITQYNNWDLQDVSLQGSTGTQYSTGTVSITNGSTSLAGSGTTFPTQIPFGHLWINGDMQEITSRTSGTAATLTSNWQYPTASSASYTIDYGGVGLMLEGTSVTGFTQYGNSLNFYSLGNRVGVDLVGGPTSSSGVSRPHFIGGFVNGNRVTDSIGLFAGKFSDTVEWDVPVNNVARGVVIESGHAHRIRGEFENTGAFTAVSTCNGGVAAQSCTQGITLLADATTTGHDNAVIGADIQNWGNGIEFDSANVTTSTIVSNPMRSNTNNYVFSDASTGCSTTQVNATILQADCSNFQTPLTVDAGGTGTSTPSLVAGTNVTITGSWPNQTINSSGGASGFPITLGSTSITSGSTTTTVAGLTLSSPTLTTPALGTPASGVLTNATGLPISTGVAGLGTGVATFLATPSSANLATTVTGETGSGALVFGTSPSLTTPNIGAATASGLTLSGVTGSTQCLQANSSGVVSGTGSACGSGSSGISGQAAGVIPLASTATTIGAQSALSDNGTTVTSTEPIAAPSFGTNGANNGSVSLTSTGTAPGAAATSTVQVTVPNTVTAYTRTLAGAAPSASSIGVYSTSGVESWTPTAGSGAAIPTGPTSSTTTDLVSYTGTAGQQQDSGIASGNVVTQTSNATSGQICTYTGANKICVPASALPSGVTATTQTAKTNNGTVATTQYVDRPTGLTTGTSVTLTAPRQYFVCTAACTITVPVPAAGYEFCVQNDVGVSSVITLSALGSSAMYGKTDQSAYGTAGTGTFVSGGAVGDKICLLGKDATHYNTASFNGSWTAN